MDISSKKKLRLTRIINAPRELVYKAFTNREMLMQWWGPYHFENSECEIESKVNGKFEICMYSPKLGYPKNWCKGVYLELKEPEHIVFTLAAFFDENKTAKLENVNTITLENENGKTKLTIHVEVKHIDEELYQALNGMEQGWSESLEKLNTLVAIK